ncbi:MFS transporter [Paenibacillus sp. UNC499MF]|uniref:MFS transporter n=1 Tax=Paenibacillus sp. UNC499MF TaxID=1502751 RepID=UPI0008A0399F|nr:MFS transporter [Paenibacillus sp. UNC499MF]SEG38533.1 Major Facilitator Superfamily protein [Paenibacillus sp. UNC499MF]
MKTAIWLYFFMFVAFFDLHAQYPILTPFALSLGAAPSFIGLIMGMYSLTHLPGNLLAGYGVDKYGSKLFIVFSLIVAGIVLIFQSQVKDPWQLLMIRSISGFVLAFLSPACLSMLAKIARDSVHQSKLMAGNGLIHTLASVVSPAAGAYLVAQFGFTASFTLLGWLLIVTGLLSIPWLKETRPEGALPPLHTGAGSASASARNGVSARTRNPENGGTDTAAAPPGSQGAGRKASQLHAPAADNSGVLDGSGDADKIPWMFYFVPLAISCSQGILFFELPLMKTAQSSLLTSGLFFSVISLGALVTLSMLFLNRIPPAHRTVAGALSLAVLFFGLAVDWPLPLTVTLFMIGMAKGLIFPSLATLLAGITSSNRYGRVFSLLSIAYSIGAFIGPMVAGKLRDSISPYFLAFVILMAALTLLPFRVLKHKPVAV